MYRELFIILFKGDNKEIQCFWVSVWPVSAEQWTVDLERIIALIFSMDVSHCGVCCPIMTVTHKSLFLTTVIRILLKQHMAES